jgi:hypothetical protein
MIVESQWGCKLKMSEILQHALEGYRAQLGIDLWE